MNPDLRSRLSSHVAVLAADALALRRDCKGAVDDGGAGAAAYEAALSQINAGITALHALSADVCNFPAVTPGDHNGDTDLT